MKVILLAFPFYHWLRQLFFFPRRMTLVLLTSLVWPTAAVMAANNLPDIGTAGLSVMSLEKERIVGDAYMRQIRGSYPLVNDPTINEYLETIGNRLLTNTEHPLHPFNFFMIHNDEINAFAMFGGYIGIHTGLFLYADNESELASVLGHEMAHVDQRHLMRQLEKRANATPATLIAALGSVLLAMVSPDAGIAALQTTLGVTRQLSINYTRANEAEADRIGMTTIVRAGFSPYGFPDFFEKLAAQTRYSSKPPAFLLSHPLPEARIADMRLRAQQYPRRTIPPNINFLFAKARIEARYGPQRTKSSVIDHFKYKLSHHDYVLEDSIHYGLALAYLDNHKPKLAQQEITPLLKNRPDNLFLVDAITDIDMALGHQQQALERLRSFYQYMPENQVIAINYGNVLLTTGKVKQAIQVLREFSYQHPDSTLALSMLEDAYGKVNDLAQQYVIRAQRLALVGGYDKAIQQLRVAQRHIQHDDEVEEARIDARIREYQQAQIRLKTL